jgi:nitroimidazol reductase NimA-like FMN-containing flavoprotein (pyridoxamine 5'-phosphate oxidase superfamily)
MCKNNIPYIVPVSFGFDGNTIFVHTATEGRKIEFWTSNSLVCFEFELDIKTIEHPEKACKWTASFKSVIGYGNISEIITDDEKFFALDQIMFQYSGSKWEYSIRDLKGMRVWKIEIIEMTGKKS